MPSSTRSSTRVPGHVLVVIDQAYREYVDDPDYPDAIEEYFKAGRPVAVLRTFSKIYGLAGLRVGYMVAPPAVVTAVNKVKRAFDVSTRGAGGRAREPRRRRTRSPAAGALNAEATRPSSRQTLARRTASSPPGRRSRTSSTPRPAPTRGRCSRRCSREGVIVRPLHGFGAPTAIRVTCGTPDENAFFADALARVRGGVPAR